VRVEGHNRTLHVLAAGTLDNVVYHMLVSQMKAIELANGHNNRVPGYGVIQRINYMHNFTCSIDILRFA
jgi:hypothetical protein